MYRKKSIQEPEWWELLASLDPYAHSKMVRYWLTPLCSRGGSYG